MVLIAHELCRSGVVCHLVPLNLQESEIWALRPDLVMLNFLRRGTEPFAARMRTAGIQYGLIDTEGGVWGSPADYAEILWQDSELRGAAHPLCIWGPKLARFLAAAGYFDASRLQVTGCPRFDFYAPQWSPVLQPVERPNGTEPVSRILINTNFSLTNGRFASPAQNLEDVRSTLGWSKETTEAIASGEGEAIEGMLQLVERLAEDYPRCRIVLRPHPFERPETYSRRVARFRNVELNTDGPVQPQIFRAAAVIQRSCSTAVEAGLASIPTLSPQWIPAPILMPMAEAVSHPCASYQDLQVALEAILAGSYSPATGLRRAVDEVIHDWFYRGDGLAHRRISEAILAGLPGSRRTDEGLCHKLLYGVRTEGAGAMEALSRMARYHLHLSPDWSFRHWRSVPSLSWTGTDKFFGVETVQALVERIRTAAGLSSSGETVTAGYARDRHDYECDYHGHTITLTGSA